MNESVVRLATEIRALGADRQHGAAEIARRARRAFLEALAAGVPTEALARAGASLLVRQPAMAPLYRVVNDACRGRLRREGRPIRLSLQKILPNHRAEVFTYSNSATVREAILASRGRIARVSCSEARPGGEGVALFRSLARAGLPVRLLADAALASRVGEADLVVVGADALAPEGVVNKVGTRVLAQMARTGRRPFYVVATREKILPARLARAAARLRAGSVLFDSTPYRLVSGIVTEAGILSRRALFVEMRRLDVSRTLVVALRDVALAAGKNGPQASRLAAASRSFSAFAARRLS